MAKCNNSLIEEFKKASRTPLSGFERDPLVLMDLNGVLTFSGNGCASTTSLSVKLAYKLAKVGVLVR